MKMIGYKSIIVSFQDPASFTQWLTLYSERNGYTKLPSFLIHKKKCGCMELEQGFNTNKNSYMKDTWCIAKLLHTATPS